MSRFHGPCFSNIWPLMEVKTIFIGDKSPGSLGTLNLCTRKALIRDLQDAFNDAHVGCILIVGASPKWFSVGADIRELSNAISKDSFGIARSFLETYKTHNLAPIIEMIDAAPKPVVALLTGSAYGGGLEIALSCQYRIMSETAMLQFPEVSLGIIPGAFGTQLLPRLAKFETCLRMCIEMARLSSFEALEEGLVDQIMREKQSSKESAPPRTQAEAHAHSVERWMSLVERSVDLLKGHLRGDCYVPSPFRRTSTLRPMTGLKDAMTLAYNTLKALPCVERGGRARRAAVECLVAAVRHGGDFTRGALVEARVQSLLVGSPEAQALRAYFMAERSASKPPDVVHHLRRERGVARGLSASYTIPLGVYHRDRHDSSSSYYHYGLSSSSSSPYPPSAMGRLQVMRDALHVERLAVIGAGQMGTGIAAALLQACGGGRSSSYWDENQGKMELHVTICDANAAALGRARTVLGAILRNAVRRRRLSQKKCAHILASCVTFTTHLEDVATCQVVLEAVFENMSVKVDVLKKVAKIVAPSCIICSNTSSLDLAQMAELALPPARRPLLVGWHFFAPAHRMKVVEVVQLEGTNAAAVSTVLQLTYRCGKIPILCGNCSGFIGNRMVFPYVMEAMHLLEDGATVSEVDAICREFGFAMGPFEMSDLSGLDVGYFIRKDKGLIPSSDGAVHHDRYCTVADDLYRQGRLGMKSGCGFYSYMHDAKGRPRPLIPGDGQDPVVTEAVAKSKARHCSRYCADLGLLGSLSRRFAILDRLLMPLINQGFHLLGEGIVASDRPGDIDVVYVQGYGFPAWRGGPMFYAHQRGLANILETLRRLQARYGGTEYLRPAPLLVCMVRRNIQVTDIQHDPDLCARLMADDDCCHGGGDGRYKIRARL